ncbi:uncharacterized protein At4g15545-like isoform X2 [Salvia hispanica]|uniref:uncharacterized protein At4g15545-like isoform X2 n=1 Tax=Salvia hispanica TaxID=49212 RepID=UPI00200904FB|nr:uncharacterized protein At4g15545-like isoform X2 [Salvia hispanica]
MVATESSRLELPEELVEVLPLDPFEQLDVARKITSIALSTRLDSLESEMSELRQHLADRDDIITGMESQLQSLDVSFAQVSDKLAAAQREKESLLKENTQLSNTVKKLNRDVTKLGAFRKTLMRSLQDDDDTASGPKANLTNPSSNPDDSDLPPNRNQSQLSDAGTLNSVDTNAEVVRPHAPYSFLLASQNSTPRLTPPGSPPSLSASVSPSRTPQPLSPRRQRHSIAITSTRGLYNDRSSVFSSLPPSQFSSMSSMESRSQPGKTRVDGKEFFRQVRSRLSYEQFSAFLANVKELNSHKQTKEETLGKADEIFGPDNKDLYAIFEGLITRNVQ